VDNRATENMQEIEMNVIYKEHEYVLSVKNYKSTTLYTCLITDSL